MTADRDLVVLEFPSRTILVAHDEEVRFLRWSWWRRVRRRFVVRTLPLGLLLDTLAAIGVLAELEAGFDIRAAVVVIAGAKAAALPPPALERIYETFRELNGFPKALPPVAPAVAPDSEPASPPSSDASRDRPSAMSANGSSE